MLKEQTRVKNKWTGTGQHARTESGFGSASLLDSRKATPEDKALSENVAPVSKCREGWKKKE